MKWTGACRTGDMQPYMGDRHGHLKGSLEAGRTDKVTVEAGYVGL